MKLCLGLVAMFIVGDLQADSIWSRLGHSVFVEEIRNDQVVSLSGEWEFYWHELLTPEDFKKKNDLAPRYLQVPGSWHQQGYPVLGYGTYKARIVFQKKLENGLLIYIPLINSAAKIWLNGVLIKEIGHVGTNASSASGQLSSLLIPVSSGDNQIELIMQVSNFTYFFSGITGKILIGDPSVVLQRVNINRSMECLFAGSILAMFIYHIILFALYKKGRSYLYLALICLMIAIRGLTTNGGSHLFPDLFPSVEMEYWKKLEFFAVYSLLAFFPAFISSLFPDKFPKLFLRTVSFLSVLFCLLVLFSPQYIYGSVLDFYHVILLSEFLLCGKVIYSAYKNGNKEARIILWGVAGSFPFTLIEILNNSGLTRVPFGHLIELGVLIFLLFQSYLLANRNARAFTGLAELNQNLEKIVTDKTSELLNANKVKDTVLSILSHDIKSPLNSLKGILNLFNRQAIDGIDIKKLTSQVENQLFRTIMTVENVLQWTTHQLKGFQINKELISLDKAVKDILTQFELTAQQKDIKLENKIASQTDCTADKNVLDLVLRNLVANAIKFSHEGGAVELKSIRSNESTILIVKDSGVGINENVINNLFEFDSNKSTRGTKNEKGTGLGLSLCKDFINKMGGNIWVKSKEGVGTEFYIALPAA